MAGLVTTATSCLKWSDTVGASSSAASGPSYPSDPIGSSPVSAIASSIARSSRVNPCAAASTVSATRSGTRGRVNRDASATPARGLDREEDRKPLGRRRSISTRWPAATGTGSSSSSPMSSTPGSDESHSSPGVRSCHSGRNPSRSTAPTTSSPLRPISAAGPCANGPQTARW